MPISRGIAAAALRELRAHKRTIDDAIAKLERYEDTTARVALLIPRDELRRLIELAKRSHQASRQPQGSPPAPPLAA